MESNIDSRIVFIVLFIFLRSGDSGKKLKKKKKHFDVMVCDVFSFFTQLRSFKRWI